MMNQAHSLLIACLSVLAIAVSTVRAEDSVGLSETKPVQGRYVETDRGYMVPYRRMIPGSDVSFEMVPVPGGTLRIQSGDSEIEVPIEPFWMGRCEVTWAEYHEYCQLLGLFYRFQREGIRKVTRDNEVDAVTAPSTLYDAVSYYPETAGKEDLPRHPAAAMTQYAAKQYTKWLSKLTGTFYRLPSEAEWEYACRAGSNTTFCFGDDERQLGEYAWYFDNSGDDTHPVGLKKPNRWGLFDMHGNVGEWVLDQYTETLDHLSTAAADGRPPIRWPTRLHPRTVRGGSWDCQADECRSASRVGSSVDWHDEEPRLPVSPHWLASGVQRRVGFRIARPLDPPPSKLHRKYWDAYVLELRRAVTVYCSDGSSSRGIVDSKLPAAIKQITDRR